MEYPNVVYFLKQQIEHLRKCKGLGNELRADVIEEFEAAIKILGGGMRIKP